MKKFELKLRRRDIPIEDIIADIRKVAKEIGEETFTSLVYDKKGSFGKTTILRKFGGWNKALEAAGLKVQFNANISNEELFENLADVWQHLGRQPFGREMEKTDGISKYSLGTYEKRFQTWNNALLNFINHVNRSQDAIQGNLKIEKREASITNKKTPRKINWRLRAQILIRDNCICKMCGASPAKDPSVILHVDHIVPYSKNGETFFDNLQTLCHVCNIGKSNKEF
jgi:hypothetical protein